VVLLNAALNGLNFIYYMHPTAQEVDRDSASMLLQALSCLLKEEDAQRVELAHLLHKDMAGGLVACSSLGEMMRHELANGGDAASVSRLLSSLDSTLRQTLQLVRDMTEKQFPPVLKAFGLNVALQQLVRNIGENFAGSLVLHISGDEPNFNLASRLNLFRIMQALLKHCVRFANTSWVEVTCRASDERLEITIDHDGGDSIWNETGIGSEMALIEARCTLLGSRMQVMGASPDGSSRICLVALPSPPSLT
jgi:glucose-6-phosphate-specific signal transduction histidine kinase